uniref:Uncharacterized protein n=1 Tax=Mustela putorius furo TaxID=9669 RepID=M3YE60_MUSPF
MCPLQRVGAVGAAYLTEASSNRSHQCLHPESDKCNPSLIGPRRGPRGPKRRRESSGGAITAAGEQPGAGKSRRSVAGRCREGPVGRGEGNQHPDHGILRGTLRSQQHPMLWSV